MTDREVGPNVGTSLPPYKRVNGYSHVNLFMRFTQEGAGEPPVARTVSVWGYLVG